VRKDEARRKEKRGNEKREKGKKRKRWKQKGKIMVLMRRVRCKVMKDMFGGEMGKNGLVRRCEIKIGIKGRKGKG
jgi:hypothetical protein